jgi:hypothetical protein
MKNAMVTCTALAVILSLWLSGCGASPPVVAPTDEATGSPATAREGETLQSAPPSPTDTPGASAEAKGRTKPPASTPQTEEESAPAQPTQAASATKVTSGQQHVVEMAKEDLARRLALSGWEISVSSVQAVEWPDASLGCPQPGMAYAQVITPGFLIVLEAAGQTYEYHSDASHFVILCLEHRTSPAPLIPADPDEIDDGEPWLPVH